MSALQKIIAARTSLVLEQPFFGSLALRLKLLADPSCQTAWVDGRTLGYNPAFVESLNHDELVGLVAHEVEHVALGHPWRRGGREPKRWNIACDKAINSHLAECGFHLPADVYYAEGDEVGKSAEWIHSHMVEPEPEPEPEAGKQGGEQESDGEGESDADGEGSGKGEGKGDGKGDPQGEVRDAPTGPDADGDPAPSEQEWKEATATAAALAKAQGNLSAGVARAIAEALKPRVDVRALLLRFMQERTASDYNWSRPNARYMAQGTYLPALAGVQLGHVAIMVDTSGSIDNVILGAARSIVQDVLDECNPAGVSLYFADARVCAVERLERGEALTWKPQGGGGTDFRPALAAIEQDENEPVCCICITDLQGTFPTVAPEIPVLWLATQERDWRGNALNAPFGETIFVGE